MTKFARNLTAAIIALGTLIALARERVLPALEARPFPVDGARVLTAVDRLAERVAAVLVRPIASDDPMRHLAAIVIATLVAFGVGYAVIVWFMRLIENRSYLIFVIYRIAAGVALLGLLWFGVIDPLGGA